MLILKLVSNRTLLFILMLTYPFMATFSCRLYRCIMYGGQCFSFMVIYYGSSIREAKKKPLRLHDMNHAPFFCIVNDTVQNQCKISMREAAGVPGSSV